MHNPNQAICDQYARVFNDPVALECVDYMECDWNAMPFGNFVCLLNMWIFERTEEEGKKKKKNILMMSV